MWWQVMASHRLAAAPVTWDHGIRTIALGAERGKYFVDIKYKCWISHFFPLSVLELVNDRLNTFFSKLLGLRYLKVLHLGLLGA